MRDQSNPQKIKYEITARPADGRKIKTLVKIEQLEDHTILAYDFVYLEAHGKYLNTYREADTRFTKKDQAIFKDLADSFKYDKPLKKNIWGIMMEITINGWFVDVEIIEK